MRGKTLAVLALAVLLLAAVLWLDRERPGSDERSQRAELLLPALDPDAVEAVTLEPPATAERPAVRLERMDGGWRVAAPKGWAGRRADASAVEEMLAELADLRRERRLDDVVEAEVGLDRPRARARLERRGAAPLLLEVGGEVPASRNLVMRVSEGAAVDAGDIDTGNAEAGNAEDFEERGVYLVDREILAALVRPEWRDRRLFHHERGDVVGVTLEGPQGRVELARRGGGPGVDGFDVVAPVRDVADDDRVGSLLATLVELTADRFVDAAAASGDAGDMGLDPPLGTVTVELTPGAVPLPDAPGETAEGTAGEAAEGDARNTLAEGVAAAARSLRITVGRPRPDGTVHLRLEGETGLSGGLAGGGPGPPRPLLVATHTLLAEELSIPPRKWASHRLTEHRAFDVTGLVVVDGAQRLDFDRIGDDWSMEGEPVSYLPLSEVLNAVTEAEAVELRPADPGVAEPVTRSFTLRVKNGVERVETIRFHGTAGEDGRVRVTVDGRPPVFVLDGRQAERVDALLDELRQEVRESAL